jgi:heme-degrading monooxygenase HmoA
MSVIKINAITVDPESGDELAHRFAARAGAVDDQDGFEGFELLKPTDDRTVWLVVTRWRDEEAFTAWLTSPAFSHGHRQGSRQGGEPAAGHGQEAGQGSADEPQRPVGVQSELWSYVVAGGSQR